MSYIIKQLKSACKHCEVEDLPLSVQNSPFSKEQAEKLNELLQMLTDQQKLWLSGYLTYPFAEQGTNPPGSTAVAEKPVQTATKAVTLLFGSETGNAQALAEEFAARLKEMQFAVSFSALDAVKPKDLKNAGYLLIITSTQGEGDPPDNALSFYELIHSRKAPKLDGVPFSVLALGDQTYDFFCKVGKEIDKRLEELGGERLYPRVDCDVDYEEDAREWFEGVAGVLRASALPAPTAADATRPANTDYSKSNPFQAEVLENINLNWEGSNKKTHHIELSLEGSGFTFEPGDSIGIYPENDPELVERLIEELGWDPEEPVPVNKKGEVLPAREALLRHYEITRLTKPLLQQAAVLFGNKALTALLENEAEAKAYLEGRGLLDLVEEYPPEKVEVQAFVQMLRKMPPRLYSIASSWKANPDEVHLVIALDCYTANGRVREGVCSGQIAGRIKPGDKLPVYVHRNPNFKLPADPDVPVIMIGPGTGVAPFRSFLEEREAEGITGRTWLFYGDQHFATDFLYQLDWQNWLKNGVLERMDVAFSRDQAEKIYVQHRMLEKSKDFYAWLEKGACVYVCGDEKHMARDVQETLLQILETEGNMAREEAEGYLQEMRRAKRYQRDVY
ncbi:assimilatory sulfite reductase (NADPH) flavoprotein subunit [Heyndrickxia coagulans]|uniref:assimilatory sulfite reductase (NADPH) flavoprotein subunit n=1 Tax=Heyndrickxia coagulans TaxID=1398 RepID=UPI000688EF5D|nr:assimilatory sulfite reductase (NADPH) flavoprotein subunit [Heyndrickxia coagulans]MCR2846732.1 assimilatory sulfite reductase (NADPH) flavoprotein subunit [Heyndrickxia coagulans]MDR4225156.1 assimilatory sulfite reductase (NADPH) flavoprotein subunit [Heyndrickxia coagulans DSM 1 = ATCC 7050]MED4495152.1 assimilatory sulfite reductase (NADPH) flavoprotein subunit [Heyndrickxia coagulans]MED4535780.1 assimilatory sulfite reductase (NADPH) flavoprotein subunit [Heyndrickxia coagulans]QJE33